MNGRPAKRRTLPITIALLLAGALFLGLLKNADVYAAPLAQTGQSEPTVSDSGIYTVQPGDTVASIAAHFGMSAEDLRALNRIGPNNLIIVGQELRVSGGTAAVGESTVVSATGKVTATVAVTAGDEGMDKAKTNVTLTPTPAAEEEAVATAAAEEEATATPVAEEEAAATAAAEEEATATPVAEEEVAATAAAEEEATATSVAEEEAVATAAAEEEATATPVAEEEAAATAAAEEEATATPVAEEEAVATAAAEEEATATPVAEEEAVATAAAEEEATATGIAEEEATATAVAEEEAVATEAAEEEATATPVAEEDATATPVAEEGATATAVAEEEATATAVAEEEAAATAVAEEEAAATAVAEEEAAATAVAEEEATATSVAEEEATATPVAEEEAVATAVAEEEATATLVAEEEAAVQAVDASAPITLTETVSDVVEEAAATPVAEEEAEATNTVGQELAALLAGNAYHSPIIISGVPVEATSDVEVLLIDDATGEVLAKRVAAAGDESFDTYLRFTVRERTPARLQLSLTDAGAPVTSVPLTLLPGQSFIDMTAPAAGDLICGRLLILGYSSTSGGQVFGAAHAADGSIITEGSGSGGSQGDYASFYIGLDPQIETETPGFVSVFARDGQTGQAIDQTIVPVTFYPTGSDACR